MLHPGKVEKLVSFWGLRTGDLGGEPLVPISLSFQSKTLPKALVGASHIIQ
jgi:hypothetical protein